MTIDFRHRYRSAPVAALPHCRAAEALATAASALRGEDPFASNRALFGDAVDAHADAHREARALFETCRAVADPPGGFALQEPDAAAWRAVAAHGERLLRCADRMAAACAAAEAAVGTDAYVNDRLSAVIDGRAHETATRTLARNCAVYAAAFLRRRAAP